MPARPRRKPRPAANAIELPGDRSRETPTDGDGVRIAAHDDGRLPARKPDGNPEGKGAHGFLTDWSATEPRGVIAKPRRRVLAELFTSMLVLSASFRYRPVPGAANYLYWIDGHWSLSLIAPSEWSERRRAGFAGTCVLQHDMTWTITPSGRLTGKPGVVAAIRRFYDGFAGMLDTDLTLEEILPFHVASLPYYQRLYASALSRSVSVAVAHGDQVSNSCRRWQRELSSLQHPLLACS
jgi:hypothetical protein